MSDRLRERNRPARNRPGTRAHRRSNVTRPIPATDMNAGVASIANGALNAGLGALWLADSFAAGVGTTINAATGGGFKNPMSPEERVLPGEAIRKNVFGIEKPSWGTFVPELLLDIGLDPTTYYTFGGSIPGAAGRALRKIGKYDAISEVASRKLADDAVSAARKAAPVSRKTNPLQASANMDTTLSPGGDALESAIAANKASKTRVNRVLNDAGQTVDKYNTVRARPLVGSNVGMRMFDTLDDFLNTTRRLKGAPYTDDLIQKLQIGKSPQQYADLLQSPLGGDNFGFNFFGYRPTFNLPGGLDDSLAAGRDNVADWLRYHPQVGARYSRAYDRDTTTLNPAGQALQRETAATGREFQQIALGQTRALTRELNDLVAKAGLPPETIKDPKFMEAVDRLLEGNAATLADLQLVKSIPGMNRWLTQYHRVNKDILAGSKRAGVQAHEVADPFGNKYRSYAGMNTPFYDASGKLENSTPAFSKAFDTVSQSMQRRAEAFKLPGGLDQRRYILRNYNDILQRAYPNVSPSQLTEDEVASALFADITRNTNGLPNYYDTIPGSRLAKSADPLMGEDPKDVLKNVRGMVKAIKAQVTDGNELTEQSLKGLTQTPLESMATNAPSRGVNIGVGSELTQDLASNARLNRAKQLPMVGPDSADSLTSMRNKLGLQGPENEQLLKTLIADDVYKRTGRRVSPNDIPLEEYSIPSARKKLYEQAARSGDQVVTQATAALENPTIASALMSGNNLLDGQVNKFKALILSFPAKYTRDLTSSLSMNSMHHNIGDLQPSYQDANRLLNGDFDWVADQLERGAIRGYETYGTRAEKLKAFISDLDKYDPLSQGRAMGYANELKVNKNVLSNTIGLEPSGLVQGKFQTTRQLLSTINPANLWEVVRSKELQGTELTELADILNTKFDGVNRLASVFASMRNGVPMEEAVRVANDLHVRYDDLSGWEKTIRRVIPFMSYDRGMRQTQINQFLTNPGGVYPQLLRARERYQGREDDDVYTPQYMREGTGGPVPEEMTEALNRVTGKTDGTAWYLQNFDFPGAASWDYGGIVNANPDRPIWESIPESVVASTKYTGNKLMSKVAPQFKSLAEGLFDRDFYRGRQGVQPGPVSSTYLNLVNRWQGPEAGQEAYKYGRDKGFYNWEAAANAIPAVSGLSRLTRLAEQLTDPGTVREQAGTPTRPIYNNVLETMFNTVAPFKLKSLTPMEQTRNARGDLNQSLNRIMIGPQQRAMKHDDKHGPIVRRAIQTERQLKKNLENME